METILSGTRLGPNLTSAFERPEYGQRNSVEDRTAMLTGTGKRRLGNLVRPWTYLRLLGQANLGGRRASN